MDRRPQDFEKLARALKRRETEMAALLKASRAVLGYASFGEAAQAIFHGCRDLIGATAGYVALLSSDDATNELLFLESGGLSCTVDPSLPMPVRGLRQEAYRTGRVVYDNDFGNSHWVKLLPPGHVRLDSVMFVPLVFDQKPRGLMGLAQKPGGFTDDDARLAAAFGELAAIALKNSQTLDSLRSSQEALKQADRRKDEFLAVLAHELRSPLTPLLHAAQIMKRPGIDAAVIEQARKVMEDQVWHMTRLIEDLLDISRITRGKITLRKERVDLGMVVESAVKANLPLIEDGNHELTVSVPEEPLFLMADPTRISQVLSNLLNNSCKFSGDGGQIELVVERHADHVVIRVRDDGIGMSADLLPLIFEKFIQAGATGARGKGGLGVGLALARSLVQMHGGTIEARSEGPGKGTEITVSIPLLDMDLEETPTAECGNFLPDREKIP